LRKYVDAGKFREDLFYRLNVIDIHLPALKDRPGDVALLVSRFLREFSRENADRVTGIDARAMKVLEDYSWPGNVRELRNVVEKMVVLSAGERLGIEDIPVEITEAIDAAAQPAPVLAATPTAAPAIAPANPAGCDGTLKSTEKARILASIAANGGNKTKAAEELGISRRTLHRKLNEWKTEQ
jgi:DNA-binding NtrC family response regulator